MKRDVMDGITQALVDMCYVIDYGRQEDLCFVFETYPNRDKPSKTYSFFVDHVTIYDIERSTDYKNISAIISSSRVQHWIIVSLKEFYEKRYGSDPDRRIRDLHGVPEVEIKRETNNKL
jgi:hypothetical protein